ncbi:hypothetical protein [Pontixanthobacter sp.]|uniref:hypothetical protein n=1 Tax=Pontixanthobacter sp. TaxID=2792078 RepID=UPI003C7BCBCC
MSRKPDQAAKGRAFEAEQTEAGSQTLVPGVAPVTLGERLGVLANAPLLPRKGQRPANHGLFDTNARKQLEMF